VRDREIERDESLRGQSLRVRDRPMMGLCVRCGARKWGKRWVRDREIEREMRAFAAPSIVTRSERSATTASDGSGRACNTPSPLRLGLSPFFFSNKIFTKIHKVYQST
jgi:hypothetical protein